MTLFFTSSIHLIISFAMAFFNVSQFPQNKSIWHNGMEECEANNLNVSLVISGMTVFTAKKAGLCL